MTQIHLKMTEKIAKQKLNKKQMKNKKIETLINNQEERGHIQDLDQNHTPMKNKDIVETDRNYIFR